MKLMFSVVLLTIAAAKGAAQAATDPTEIVLPYSSTGSRTFGDAINIQFPAVAVGRCVSYEDSAIKWDSDGAISSDGSIHVVSDYTKDRDETDLDLGLKTTAKVNAGVFDANSTTDVTFHTNKVRTDEERSITVVFHAYADYGRRIIENYSLSNTAPHPNDTDPFIKQCGTHFIRGQHRESELSIMVEITTSSKAGKDVLDTSLTNTIGGGVTLKAISGDASATLSSKYKSIIDFARVSGDVHVESVALGGPGISAAGAAAKLSDPADLVKLANIADGVTSLFNRDNSSVTAYILQSNTALGATAPKFDLSRTERIGALTRELIKVSDAAQRLEDIRTKSSKTFNTYFAAEYGQIVALKSDLVEKIKTCAGGGACANPDENVMNRFPFLEDLFQDPSVELSCQYQEARDLLPGHSDSANNPKVLESLSINMKGRVPFYDLVDFTSVRITRLTTDDLNIQDVTDSFSGFAFSLPGRDARGARRAFGTIYSENIRPRDLLVYDAASKSFSVNEPSLRERREKVLMSAFSISAPGPAGYKVSFETGYPPRTGCPLTQ